MDMIFIEIVNNSNGFMLVHYQAVWLEILNVFPRDTQQHWL